VATQLRDATRQLNTLVRNRIFDLRRAKAQGDNDAMIMAALKIMQLNLNREEMPFREAEVELKNATRAKR
jgi:hypothetical protein